MPSYSHRQRGTVILLSLGLTVVLIAALFVAVPESSIVMGMVFAILLATIALFYSLTIEVDSESLMWSFGIGLIKDRVRIDDIKEVRVVTNPWYYGWGIHLTPAGWLYNVSGRQAVELRLTSDKTFRLGTDDPEGLAQSIRSAMTA